MVDAGFAGGPSTRNPVQEKTREYLMGLEDKPLMDEFVALYLRVSGSQNLEAKFRETLVQAQDEGAYHLSKSGDMERYAIKRLETLLENNKELIGKGQNAAQAAQYQNMYSGRDPNDYSECFSKLKIFIDQSLDECKSELVRVLFPIFVCLYLNMILKKFYPEARAFLEANQAEFERHHKNEIALLQTVNDQHRLEDPEVAKYLKNKFFVKMSRHSYTLLKYQVDFNQLNLIMHIMNLNIYFQISSEQDMVLDSRVHESILLNDCDNIENIAGQESNVNDGAAQGGAQNTEQQVLALGRLKEFYLEVADLPTSATTQPAGQATTAPEAAQKEAQGATTAANPSSGTMMISTTGAPAANNTAAAVAEQRDAQNRQQQLNQQQQAGQSAALRRQKRAQANLMQPKIPMPEIETELKDMIYAEMRQQQKLSEKYLPSIGSINLLNSNRQVNCTALSQSGHLLATGLADSSIKVYWLDRASLVKSLGMGPSNPFSEKDPQQVLTQTYQVTSHVGLKMQLYADQYETAVATQSLQASQSGSKRGTAQSKQQSLQQSKMAASPIIQALKNSERLALDLRPDLEESKIIKEQSEFTLVGHSGPVFAVSISLDDKFLISGSQDCTVRRWSIQTRSCMVVYHSHQFPVWDVKFAPLGHYFASCSNDRTACIWNQRYHSPLRILAGHIADVEVVEFHPNMHYVATGSSDKQVRLWSVETGECVRLMFTVSSAVRSLAFTKAGSHLIAGNDKGTLVVFDLNRGQPIDIIQTCQQRAVWSIDVCWDDNLIAIGTEVGSIELYSIKKILQRAEQLIHGEHKTAADPLRNVAEQLRLVSGASQPGAASAIGGAGTNATNQILTKTSHPAFVRCYQTKGSGVQLAKFSFRNFLNTVSCIEKSYC